MDEARKIIELRDWEARNDARIASLIKQQRLIRIKIAELSMLLSSSAKEYQRPLPLNGEDA